MRPAVSPWLRRSAAVTILLALLFAVVTGVILPIVDEYDANRSAADMMRATAARLQRAQRDLPALRAELEALKQQPVAQAGLLQGANESLIAAQLQSRIKALVESARGELKSTQILPGRDESNFRRIAIRSQMAISIVGLQRVLYELESASPFLFLDNIDIRARPVQRQRERGAPDGVLEVRFDVFGYARSAT